MLSPGRARQIPTLAIAATLALAIAACGSAGPTPSPTPSPTPTAAPTPSPTPTPAATATQPPGTPGFGQTGRIEVSDAGFAITLADGWIALPLNEDDLRAIVDALPPGLGLEEQLPTLLASGVKLWAVDASGGSRSNLNVFRQEAAIPVSLLRSFAEAGLAAVPGIVGEPAIEDATVDGVEGIRVTYELSVPSSGTTVEGTQLYLVTESSLYVFTFTTATGDDVAIDTMVNSIEFL
jgi:predicted small lipoprotein YifL